CGFGPVGNAEPSVDRGKMELDGMDGQVQTTCRFGVRESPRDHLEYFELAWSQLDEPVGPVGLLVDERDRVCSFVEHVIIVGAAGSAANARWTSVSGSCA